MFIVKWLVTPFMAITSIGFIKAFTVQVTPFMARLIFTSTIKLVVIMLFPMIHLKLLGWQWSREWTEPKEWREDQEWKGGIIITVLNRQSRTFIINYIWKDLGISAIDPASLEEKKFIKGMEWEKEKEKEKECSSQVVVQEMGLCSIMKCRVGTEWRLGEREVIIS